MKLSLVIPCYNEARSIPDLARRCRDVLLSEPDGEIILVDNGSTDDSPAVLEQAVAGAGGLRSIRVPVNQGYGHGILSGLAAAQGDILGWTHADLQTDPMDAVRGLELFRRAADPSQLFVKGQRYGRRFSDVAFTTGMSAFETMLMLRPLRDINAQPTLFPRSLFERWRSPPDDFALDLYAYVSAKAAGLEVRRFPVRFGERVHGVSHWNVDWKSKVKFIRRTMDYSLRLRRELAAGGSGF